jgi:transposase
MISAGGSSRPSTTKKSPHAAERDTPGVREERRGSAEDVGERVESSAPASWESVTVIAAMGLDGVRAPLAFEGAVNAATFLAYVEQVPVPSLRRGDAVIFDNLGSRPSPAVSGAIGRAGASVLPLPPYRPDFDPIEEMFSKSKEFLRRVGARAREHLNEAIGGGLREVAPRDILGWFGHAGLRVMQA